MQIVASLNYLCNDLSCSLKQFPVTQLPFSHSVVEFSLLLGLLLWVWDSRKYSIKLNSPFISLIKLKKTLSFKQSIFYRLSKQLIF